jgi:hypothetical protein
MTQLDAARLMDADLHAALLDAGLADVGFYTAPGANVATPGVRIYIDRGVQPVGEFGQAVERRDEMSILLADASPDPKGRVFVESAPGSGVGEVWTLVKNVYDDGSVSRWVVRRG